MQEKIDRLEKLLVEIKEHERMRDGFDELHQLIKEEYRIEGGDMAERKMHSYVFDLWHTIFNHVDDYKKEMRRGLKRGAPSELRSFVVRFRNIVEDELADLKRTEI